MNAGDRMATSDRMATRATYVPQNKSYSKETKQSTLDKIERGIWSPADAHRKLHCSPQTIYNWIEAKENNRELHDFSHRPSYLSPTRKQAVLDNLNKIS